MTKRYRLAVLNSHPIQYFAPLYRQLAQDPEIDLTVYYCSRQGLEEYIDPGFKVSVKWDIPLLDGYKSKFLPNFPHSGKVSGFLSLINPTIAHELFWGCYDALWINGHSFVTNLFAIGIAKLLRIPIFMRCETHLLLKRSKSKQYLRKLLMTFFYRQCEVCLSIGSRNADFYRYHGVPESHLFLVPYTVDNSFFRQAVDEYKQKLDSVKQELNLPKKMPLILYVSKLLERKHPFDLLLAYQQLVSQGTQAALIFVGSGIEETILKDHVEKYQIPNVFFFGFQNQSQLPKFFACADIFVLPAENEPWGLIINEVMAAGLPVIAAEEIGSVTDLVKHGFNGFVFQSRDLNALQQYLYMLITDISLRKQMAENSRQLISKWGFEQCMIGVKAALAYVKQPTTNLNRE